MRWHKYHAQPTNYCGIEFASKAEARRYAELVLLQKAKEIFDLELQPPYEMEVNGAKICTYRGDFRYKMVSKDGQVRVVVEDVKGMKTPVYKLKRKLFEALYPGVIFREVSA